MQAEDDERRELERALYARPSGDDADEASRRDALRRLRSAEERATEGHTAEEDTAEEPTTEPEDAADPAPLSSRSRPVGAEARVAPPHDVARPRRRTALLGGAVLAAVALAAGIAIGSAGASPAPAPTTPSTAPPAPVADRLAALVEGWETTTELPTGLALIARGSTVWTPAFDTPQEDRLLLASPDGDRLCLALERPDGTFSAGCTEIESFFDDGELEVIGTASGDPEAVANRVVLRPDGSVEGGYQLVAPDEP